MSCEWLWSNKLWVWIRFKSLFGVIQIQPINKSHSLIHLLQWRGNYNNNMSCCCFGPLSLATAGDQHLLRDRLESPRTGRTLTTCCQDFSFSPLFSRKPLTHHKNLFPLEPINSFVACLLQLYWTISDHHNNTNHTFDKQEERKEIKNSFN